jgi:PLP dependent protein
VIGGAASQGAEPAERLTIAERLARIRARIDGAERAAGRPSGSVRLVAVSKTQGPDALAAALGAGQRLFGENRVQEALAKWPAFRRNDGTILLHLIGPLQTNKVRQAVSLFDVIETLDRVKLAEALAAEQDRIGRALRVFIQVNTGEEPQKAGVAPRSCDDFIKTARDTLGLSVEGLMCIPPVDEAPSLHFALMAEIARRNGLAGLSMGMSADFETAIRFGATHVRLGTALFGERPSL